METNDKLRTSTYFSLIVLGLVTFMYSIIRTRLISNLPDTNALLLQDILNGLIYLMKSCKQL